MIYVISKSTYGSYNVRDIQCNANWDCCPYSDYALIPESMVEGILATKGYCDITLNSAGTEVASFTARTIPDVPDECCGDNTVLSVNGVKADNGGNVTLNAGNVGALPTAGGTMTGALTTTAITVRGTSPTITFNETDNKNSSYIVEGNRHYLRSITSDTNYYEQYRTPTLSTGLTANKTYDFLTTKSAVTIPQGGTGATDRLGAIKNLFSVERVTSPVGVLGLTSSFGACGWTSNADLRTALGIKDYVIEQATSGGWYYQKWNSKYVTAWRNITTTPTVQGVNYVTQALPFTLANANYYVGVTGTSTAMSGFATDFNVSNSTPSEGRTTTNVTINYNYSRSSFYSIGMTVFIMGVLP